MAKKSESRKAKRAGSGSGRTRPGTHSAPSSPLITSAQSSIRALVALGLHGTKVRDRSRMNGDPVRSQSPCKDASTLRVRRMLPGIAGTEGEASA